jgi:hypothetical protein
VTTFNPSNSNAEQSPIPPEWEHYPEQMMLTGTEWVDFLRAVRARLAPGHPTKNLIGEYLLRLRADDYREHEEFCREDERVMRAAGSAARALWERAKRTGATN